MRNMKKIFRKLVLKIEAIHEWIEDSITIFIFKIKKDKGKPLEEVLKELEI